MKTVISLSVDRETLDRVDAAARDLAASRSYTARRLLADALARNPAAVPSGGAGPAGSPSRGLRIRAAGEGNGGENV